ncbi:innexin domain-containing protein [Phthorimaea operculella]|nr:innexin domain-containing protein [Phthorimaea operculella]
MLDVFRGLKNLIKVNYVHIDSPVFRLHYSITVILLISFSLIVTTRQYVGNPIDCIHTKDIPEDVLNTYCWIHSTYTLKSFFNKKVGVEVPYPGIGNSREKGKEDMSDRKIYKYYQWVCFCLFFQVSARLSFLELYPYSQALAGLDSLDFRPYLKYECLTRHELDCTLSSISCSFYTGYSDSYYKKPQ